MADIEQYTGQFTRLIYENRDTGWMVGTLLTPQSKSPVMMVGHFPTAQIGVKMQVTGTWQEHPKFGRQFAVEKYNLILPTSEDGIESYLASGLVKGIGPATAKRLVKRFGKAIFDVMDRDIEKLLTIRGIGKRTLIQIKSSWQSLTGMRELLAFFHEHGLSASLAQKIHRRYGHTAIETLKHNPYQLALDISGIGFQKADALAMKLGIAADSPFRIRAALLFALDQALHTGGHTFLPQPLLLKNAHALLRSVSTETIENELTQLLETGTHCMAYAQASHTIHPQTPVICLTPVRQCEQDIATLLFKLRKSPLVKRTNPAYIDAFIGRQEHAQHLKFSPTQKRAIAMALSAKVSIITGGPGTGKTTILKTLLHFFKQHTFRILLAAPTGRAAKRMHETSGGEAKTLHRLLEFNPKLRSFTRNAENPLACDAIIIDESSMLDIFLVRAVLKALPASTQCIFVGDCAQLPPVGPGNFLRDLIESKTIPTATLSDIFRQSDQSLIVANAHRIKHGQGPLEKEDKEALCDFYFIEASEAAHVLTLLHRLITERIPSRFNIPTSKIQVLTPMNQGALGVHALNTELQSWVNPQKSPLCATLPFHLNDRVMQIRNNYDLDVYNGDMGTILGFNRNKGELRVSFDKRPVLYTASNWEDLVLAYAITVHKSQGSEYPAIIFPVVSEHYIMLQRNLIYTALTRAKQLAIFIGSKKALAIALERADTQRRYSGLKELLE